MGRNFEGRANRFICDHNKIRTISTCDVLPPRDRPVPIPAPGMQLVTLTHVEDVAAMLASVPGNPNAVQQMYNVCSDRCITFVGG